jgi:hypothetical protein
MIVNPEVCPFCQEKNTCLVNNIESCWCNSTPVPAELIALVPAQLEGKACICAACITIFHESPSRFIEKYSKTVS